MAKAGRPRALTKEERKAREARRATKWRRAHRERWLEIQKRSRDKKKKDELGKDHN